MKYFDLIYNSVKGVAVFLLEDGKTRFVSGTKTLDVEKGCPGPKMINTIMRDFYPQVKISVGDLIVFGHNDCQVFGWNGKEVVPLEIKGLSDRYAYLKAEKIEGVPRCSRRWHSAREDVAKRYMSIKTQGEWDRLYGEGPPY